MREDKVNHQQRVQQLEMKFMEEKQQQQQELDRALESKLAEHKKLLQKNFDERAQMMDQEYKQLKTEKEKQSGGVFSEYVMPLLNTAQNVFSTFLQYKIMMKKPYL